MKHIIFTTHSEEQTFWKRLGLVLSIAACFTFFGCNNFLPVPSIPQSSDISSLNGKAIAAPLNVTASNGQKKQITVSWTPVSNAKYYFIYRADTPHSQYVQIDEATGDQSSKSISVPSGFSGYFKVAAVSGNKEISELSLASYGTSLATPIITDIQQDDNESSATIYWFMENLNEKSYLSSVQFNVICYNPDGSEKDHILLSKTENTFCTFENLNTATLYSYDVEAYLLSDQTASEKSMKVDRLTAVSLIPQVANFTATEGTEKDQRVTLTITLPQMAKTLSSTGTGGTDPSDYEDRPLYFKIQRYNEASQIYDTVVNHLSFNGQTTPLAKDHADFALYTEGNTVTWYDTDVERGIKYKYRVLSFVDNYFDNRDNRIDVTHDVSKANVKTGWVANIPAISSTQVEYTKDTAANEDDENITAEYVKSASLKLNVSWESLGKENNYKYLLVEKRFKIKSDNGEVEDNIGTARIVTQKNGSCYFDNTADIKDFEIDFNFAAPVVNADASKTDVTENADIRGYYKYSIYVIPLTVAEANPLPELSVTDNALVSKDDSSTRLVFNGEVPTPILTVADGYKSKAIITYNKQADTTYKLVRETLDTDGKVITGLDRTEDISESATYPDTTLEPGKAYQYTLYASTEGMSDIPSSTIRAYTLGKPDLTFDETAIDYSTITLKWHTTVSTLEAASIQAGISSDKHVKYTVKVPYNGNTISYDLSSHELNGTESVTFTEEDYTLNVINGTDYIFKLKNNIEYFDYSSKTPKIAAKNAGKNFGVTLVASNDRTAEDSENHNDKTVQARTLGPANTSISATKATNVKNITVKWNKIPGIEYYAVRRTCPATTADEEPKDDIIYVSKDGTVTVNEEPVSTLRTVVSPQADSFILTDQHCTASDSTDAYQANQAKIAWGLEYEYTVIPVLSTDDNPFEDFNKVTYTEDKNAIVTATGYTPGYGLNVVATKAESPDSVTVTWDKPNSFDSSKPSLWYRKENTSSWIYAGDYNKDDKKATIYLDQPEDPENRAKTLRDAKVEFAISYDTSRSVVWQPSYLSYLENKKDNNQEQQNMGYQFSLITFYADEPVKTAETFSETINWSIDQSNGRKRGAGDGITGDCYEIQVLNKNCGSKWFPIATISKGGNVTQIDKDWYDVAWTNNGNNSLTLTALNTATQSEFTTTTRLTRGSTQAPAITGEHDGLLKVQRDYKHYYRLVAKRINSDGNEIQAVLGDITSTLHDDTAKAPVYSYRKISDDEFVKGITLIVGDALLQTGVHSGGTKSIEGAKNATGATVGSFHTTHPGASKKFEWGTGSNNYIHLFRGGTPYSTDSFASAWTVNIANAEDNDSATYNQAGNICWGTVIVNHESELPSYEGTVYIKAGRRGSAGTFNVTKTYDLSIQYTHKSSSIANEDKLAICTTRNDSTYNESYDNKYTADNNSTNFYKWLPYPLGASLADGITAFDANQPCYKNLWWEVRE